MKRPVSISVREYFKTESLHSREQAQEFFASILNLVRNNEEVWVDFSGIEFISRSFADELVHLKLNSNKKDLINFCCTSHEVKTMLEIVAFTQTNKQFEKKLPVYQFDSMEKLFKYFSKI